MDDQPPRVLVTGSAGFIGFHLARRLLGDGAEVLGVDSFSDYYDVSLKEARNAVLADHPRFRLARVSVEDAAALGAAWRDFAPDVVVHLAAQAGVRYSIDHPDSYVSTNVVGTYNLLELARRHPVRHLLAASTSSVYGANTQLPFDEEQRTASPISLYAATKGATELIGHSYSHLYGVPTTFFRFFTVYGPWGRPDMALFKWTDAILGGRPIEVYNKGEMVRDFTYVDDLVDAVARLMPVVPHAGSDGASPVAPFRAINLGGGRPTPLMDYIGALEAALGTTAAKTMLPRQAGDLLATAASTDLLQRLTGRLPTTPVTEGVAAFVRWYRDYYRR